MGALFREEKLLFFPDRLNPTPQNTYWWGLTIFYKEWFLRFQHISDGVKHIDVEAQADRLSGPIFLIGWVGKFYTVWVKV